MIWNVKENCLQETIQSPNPNYSIIGEHIRSVVLTSEYVLISYCLEHDDHESCLSIYEINTWNKLLTFKIDLHDSNGILISDDGSRMFILFDHWNKFTVDSYNMEMVSKGVMNKIASTTMDSINVIKNSWKVLPNGDMCVIFRDVKGPIIFKKCGSA